MNRPPTPARDVVVVGASTGGVEALRTLVAGLPSGFPAAVLIVMHIGAHESILPSLLARTSVLPVRQARDGDLVEAGRVLVAPPDMHLTVDAQDGEYRTVLSRSGRENHTRPAIDPLFRAAAATFGKRAIGVILTGYLDDGTAGLAAIKACGGCAIVQLPEEALAPEMPRSAIDNVDVDHVLRLGEMPATLERIVDSNALAGAGAPRREDVPGWVRLENCFAVKGVDMESLELIAAPSTFTCPDCHGTLWELKDQLPRRFRCHTGHAYTERTLVAMQGRLVEDSIWSAIRALHEKEAMLRRMADEALRARRTEASADYVAQAGEVRSNAEVLRRLVVQTTDEAT